MEKIVFLFGAACNALEAKPGKLNPSTFKLINAVVWDVINQLEQTKELKKHKLKLIKISTL